MRIVQLLASAHHGDATGDAALTLSDALIDAGHEAPVHALEIDPPLRDRVRPFAELDSPAAEDTTILHFNIPSPLTGALAEMPGRRMVVYHNLTPPEMLLPWCPKIARLTALGRLQLARLARSETVDLAIGVSEYNTRDLGEIGFRRTATLPLPVDLARYEVDPDPIRARALADLDAPLFLTVGRVAPNKRIELFLKAAAYTLRWIGPRARFHVVGGTRGLAPYVERLTDLATELDLDRRVQFSGWVPVPDLVAYYRAASVYVCTSEHEGFCAPLLEAMKFGLPIVARRAAAIPETLGGAGILLEGDDPAEWAETLHLVARDETLRRTLIERGAERLGDFEPGAVARRWVEELIGP